MSLTTVNVPGKLWTNEEVPLGDQMFEGEDGLGMVEKSDENEVALHFRHYADTAACMSLYMDRSGALALAEVLRATAALGNC